MIEIGFIVGSSCSAVVAHRHPSSFVVTDRQASVVLVAAGVAAQRAAMLAGLVGDLIGVDVEAGHGRSNLSSHLACLMRSLMIVRSCTSCRSTASKASMRVG
jgi:hypothetical protein